MKKISVIVCALFLGSSVFAQDVKFGLKAGLNVSTLSNSQGGERGSRLGLNAGALGHIHLSPQWAIQPEVVFSSQGAKYTVLNEEHSLALNYINIPLQLQYMFDNGFRLEAGPQVGFLLRAKQKVGSSAARDIKDNFKSTDIGLAAGISYVAPSTGFGVDLRYNLGLTNINNVSSVKQTNRGGQIGVFYLFHHRH